MSKIIDKVLGRTPNRHLFVYDERKGLPYWESLQALEEGGPLTDESTLEFFRNRGQVSAVLREEEADQ